MSIKKDEITTEPVDIEDTASIVSDEKSVNSSINDTIRSLEEQEGSESEDDRVLTPDSLKTSSLDELSFQSIFTYDNVKAIETPEVIDNDIGTKIIQTFIVKRRGVEFLDDTEGVISYEESEQRLIWLGQVSALISSIVGIALLSSLVVQNMSFQEPQIVHPELSQKGSFPQPHVLIMKRYGQGSILVLKQLNPRSFELAWKFKVPANKKLDQNQAHGLLGTWVPWAISYHESAQVPGYFIYENLGNIFVIYGDGQKSITMITGPDNHQILPSSHYPLETPFHASLVHLGHLVWLLGGAEAKYEQDNFLPHTNCTAEKSILWSTQKQRWWEGPKIPFEGCVLDACTIALNRTAVLIFVGPYKKSYWVEDSTCIYALLFDFELMKWKRKDCVIKVDRQNTDIANHFSGILSLTCSSILSKSNQRTILLMSHEFHELNVTNMYHQMHWIQYNDFNLNSTKIMALPNLQKTASSIFVVRNIFYMITTVEESPSIHVEVEASNSKIVLYIFTRENVWEKIQNNLTISDMPQFFKQLITVPFYK